MLVSALVQAEQLGSGIAQTLRRQADDLRDRRRERANAFAMALPIKRMFPLVVCFLPGIFVWTLGPFFVQLFQIADTFLKVRNFYDMASTWRLVSETTGKTVVAQLTIADGFWSRLAGLQFRRPLASDAGLLLVPCNSVHTCFVRFPVDVVFLDGNGSVLAVRPSLRPWRLAWGPRKTHAVLEMLAGSAALQPGEKLRLEPAGGGERETPQVGGFSAKIAECGRVRGRYNRYNR